MATTKANELGQFGSKLTVHNENITLDGTVHGQYAGFDSDINASSIGDLSNVDITTSAPSNNQSLIWDNANSKFVPGDSFSQSDFNTAFGNKSTSDLSEGTNQYHTTARVRGAISATGSLGYNSSTGVMSFTQGNTDTISEGSSNLYYTDARADARVALIVDAAPGTLNTLNELAAALGDDANFSTTVTNSIATKLPLAGGAMTGAITTNSTFDGRDVATDGTKLDGIEASADVTDTANVTAAGALMDSEVTNLAQVKAFDSSDYATAAQGTTADNALPKAGGTLTGNVNFGDNDKAIFGAGSDLQIYHDGTHSYIKDTGTGYLKLGLSNAGTAIQNAAGNNLLVTDGAAVSLRYNGGQKLNTSSSGITVTGNATFADNGKAIFGAGSDLEIFHNGSNSYITDNGQGKLIVSTNGTAFDIYDNTNGHTMAQFTNNAGVTLAYQGSTKLSTTSYGADITGRLVTTSHIDAPDNARIRLGDGDDLQIYHDGSNSYIDDAGVGVLAIRSNSVRLQKYTGEEMVQADADGAVTLYHDNASKLATTATGIDVTGTVTSDGLTVESTGAAAALFKGYTSVTGVDSVNNGEVLLGNNASYQCRISYEGQTSGVLYIENSYNNDAADILFRSKSAGTAQNKLLIEGNGDISFYEDTGTTAKVFWDASAERLGIGTSSPATALDVAGNITVSGTVDGRDVAADGTKLDGIESSATADQTKSDIEGLGIDVPAANLTGTIAAARLSTATTQAESDDSTKIATTAYVTDKITTLIGGAPSTLNDLNELAAAINDDANYNSTLTTALGTKLPKSGGTMTGHILLNNGVELRSNDTGGNVRTITRVNSSNELEYGWSANAPVKFMGGGSYTERMRIHTNGNVGIGTTTPDQKLSIKGRVSSDLADSYYGAWFEGNSAANGYSFFSVGPWYNSAGYFERKEGSAYSHIYEYNANHHIAIQAGYGAHGETAGGGNVGIGTTTPDAKLHIKPTSFTQPSLIIDTPSGYSEGDMYVLHGRDTSSGIGYSSTAFGVNVESQIPTDNIPQLRSNTGGLTSAGLIYVGADEVNQGVFGVMGATGAAGTDLQHLLTVTSNGNVGIGTTSPSEKLHVQGDGADILLTDAAGGQMAKLGSSGSNNGLLELFNSSHNRTILLNSNGDSTFANKVGIGTTSPSQKLHVEGTTLLSSSTSMVLTLNPTSNNYGGILFQYNGVTKGSSIYNSGMLVYGGESGISTSLQAGGQYGLYVHHSTRNVGIGTGTGAPSEKLHVQGNIYVTGNVTAASDMSLKDNITPIPNALDKVLQIRGVTFNRNDIEDNPRHAGVIAQEVEKVLPEVVSEGEDGIKSVAYGNMVGLLIEAIKEQQEQINMLKEKLESK